MIGHTENWDSMRIRGYAKGTHLTGNICRSSVLDAVTVHPMYLLPCEARRTFKRMDKFGGRSLSAVIVSALSSGMVFVPRTYACLSVPEVIISFLSTGEKLLLTSGFLTRIKNILTIRRHQLFLCIRLILSTGGYNPMYRDVRGGYVGMGMRYEDKEHPFPARICAEDSCEMNCA